MSNGYFGAHRTKLSLDDLHAGLITANHILHHHSVFDAYSHISVRNPDSTDTFFLADTTPPSVISSLSDIIEFKFEDGSPLDTTLSLSGVSERWIDSELYKRFPGVNCVAHSHCVDVLPFCTAKVPLKPVIPSAGFLGSEAPAWDIASAYSSGIFPGSGSSGEKHDRLVRSQNLGAAFAIKFSKTSTSTGFIYSKLSESVSSVTGGHKDKEEQADPDYAVILMREHGFTVAARGIEEAVYMAIYTAINARVQREALQMSESYFGGTIEGSIPEKGGSIKGGKTKVTEEVQTLNAKEARDAWETGRENGWLDRGWLEWKRAVEKNPLYENQVQSDE
ncbi:hypothetical protein EV356DRAFT_511143 [Viridothelium virens]|uniref:Class II aldolase/adducin N-terminal domain-containing protein n=1 Tax=Viridothelium virens TaxID=1048519 RepID=A0A6A6HNZ6_VIRVR|nr:hypothetical protein EV356DRAFT_511143 [Viridothelium virens]